MASLNRLNRTARWPTDFRHRALRGGCDGRTSSAPRRVWLGQARARLNIARTCPRRPALPISLFWLLRHRSAASERPPHHCHRSCSTELTSAHHRSIRQSVTLVATPPPSPPFPPCSAHDFAFGKPRSALRRHGFALAGAPPWPLPWPCFVGAAPAV